MHVVMVCARYFPFMGGIETHVHEVARRIAAAGHRVTILTTDVTGALPGRFREAGVDIVRVKAWPAKRDYYFAPGLFGQLRELSPDLVHVQGFHTLVAPVAMAVSLLRRVPYVLSFHSGGHSSGFRNAMRGIQRLLLRPLVDRASQLIGVSEFEAALFSRTMNIARQRFIVVPNGAELPHLPGRSTPSRSKTILSVGRLERYKGHHRAIAALPDLLRAEPGATLSIIGSGPYEDELKALASRSGVADRVTIGALPPARREAMAAAMTDAALVTLLSDYEAHPVAVLEAMSLGRPVLVADTSGLSELADGTLVRAIPLDAPPAAVAMAMAEQMRATPAKRCVPMLDWAGCAARLLQVYESVIASHVKASA